MEEKREQFAAEEVKKLELDIDCAEIEIAMEEGTEQIQVAVELEPEAEYRSDISGGRLRLSYKLRHRRKHIHTGMETPRIKLTLPKDQSFEELILEVGAGSADLRRAEIRCDKVNFETGAGTIKAGFLEAKESARLEVGAGKMELLDLQTKNAKVECGVGAFSMNGKVETDLKVECGVGECEINLAGRETDYNYNVSCGIGKVRVNGTNLSGVGGKHRQENPDAAGRIDVSCGLGRVVLQISETSLSL